MDHKTASTVLAGTIGEDQKDEEQTGGKLNKDLQRMGFTCEEAEVVIISTKVKVNIC